MKEKQGPKKEKVFFLKKLIGYFFSGLILWLPVTVMVIIVLWLGVYVENFVKGILEIFIDEKYLFVGSGLTLMFLFLCLTGIIAVKYKMFQKILSKIPGIGIFFLPEEAGSTKITLEKLSNLKPCIFLYSPTCPSYGWLMTEQKIVLVLKKGEKNIPAWIHVYYPNVPSIITGQIFPIPKGNVIKLENPSISIFRALMYNLETPEKLSFLPWDDEKDEEFEKRTEVFTESIRNYGIKRLK